MSNPLSEYVQKAINAGLVIVKMSKWLKTDENSLTLTREEVEAIMLTLREQSTALKKHAPKYGDYDFLRTELPPKA